MAPSFRTSLKEFISVVFEIDDLEYKHISILLALLVNQNSQSDIQNKCHNNQKRIIHLK